MPATGTNGTHGHLKDLGASGCLWRSTSTEKQTIMNAASVPIETSSPSIAIGTSSAFMATTIPAATVVIIPTFHPAGVCRPL